MILIDAVAGALPILAIAWIVRRVMRRKATNLTANIVSVLLASVIGFVIRGFAEGTGGFWPRVENIVSFSQFPAIAAGTIVALVVSIVWTSVPPKNGGDNG